MGDGAFNPPFSTARRPVDLRVSPGSASPTPEVFRRKAASGTERRLRQHGRQNILPESTFETSFDMKAAADMPISSPRALPTQNPDSVKGHEAGTAGPAPSTAASPKHLNYDFLFLGQCWEKLRDFRNKFLTHEEDARPLRGKEVAR